MAAPGMLINQVIHRPLLCPTPSSRNRCNIPPSAFCCRPCSPTPATLTLRAFRHSLKLYNQPSTTMNALSHPSSKATSCRTFSMHYTTPSPFRPSASRSPRRSLSLCSSNSSSSQDSVNKLAEKLDQVIVQAQAKAKRSTQPYPLITSFLVLFCVANFLTQHQLLSSLAALDFNRLLNTLVPAAYATHVPREFASISLAEASVKTFLPGTWLALIASFTHINIFHLWVTTSLIKDVGEALEPQVGAMRTLGIYIAGAALSCWASTSYTGSALIGASGAASGLLGALIMEGSLKPGSVGKEVVGKLWSAGLWLLLLGFALKVTDPRVYLWGLAAGAVANAILGLLPVVVRPVLTISTAVSGIAMVAIMGVAMLRKVNLI